MKKFAIIFSIILGGLGLWSGMTALPAGPTLLAAITLPDELKPTYAPDVEILEGGNEGSYVNYFLQLLAGSLLYLAAPVAVLIIAVSGLRYVVSHGDQNAIDGAKKGITWAIIGLIVIMLSFAIIRAVLNIIGEV